MTVAFTPAKTRRSQAIGATNQIGVDQSLT